MENLFCSEVCDFVTDIEPVKMMIDVEPMLDKVILADNRVLRNMLNDENDVKIEDYCSHVQSHIAPHMRKIVTDWMLEVCEDQQCKPEVFFLSINYLDRFLSKVNIQKEQFQLCASVCILLASKFSQVVPISTDKLVIYTDSSVTAQELRQWEMKILNVLQWELSSVTTHSFLQHYIHGLGNTVDSEICIEKVRNHAESIAAMAATEYAFISAKQSVLAAAALSVAVKEEVEDEKEHKEINEKLAQMINCSYSEIVFYAHHLDKLLCNIYSLQVCSVKSPSPAAYTHQEIGLPVTPTDCVRVSAMAA